MNKSRLSLMTFPMGLDVLVGRMKIADTLRLAGDAGVPFVDLMGVSDKNLPKYQQAIRETGVQGNCYIASISFFAEKEHIRKKLEAELHKAEALGAKMLMIVPYEGGKDLELAAAMSSRSVTQMMINGFRLATEMGKKINIPVCFETTPRAELRLSASDDCKAVLDAVPGLGFVFDTANMLPAGEETLEAFEKLKRYITYVHLKDVALSDGGRKTKYAEHTRDGKLMRCVVWGKGVIPVGEVYRRLLREGYQGNFAIEYAHPTGLICGIKKHRDQLERFLASPEMEEV